MTRILVIDDEIDTLRVLSLSLRSDGYQVLCAASGEEGVELFRAQRPEIVLTDIKMPGMDGIAALQAVKRIDPGAEVIIVTGHGDIDNAIEALKHGASDFLNKPVRGDLLGLALKRAEEKLAIRRRLQRYTDQLEAEVERATGELQRRSNLMSRLIRSSNDGIVAFDERFRVVIFNPAAERIFGFHTAEVMERCGLDDLCPPAVAEALRRVAPPGDSGGEMPWQETRIASRDGQPIPVRFSGTPLFQGGAQVGSVAFFQDLREIRRLQQELLHAERLATIGQTVAGLAHGIKNMLHGFKGGRYLVELGIQKHDPQRLQSGWEMIRKNIDRISTLVLDLLSYAKEREPEYEPCQPNQIAAEVCDLLREGAREHGVELLLAADPRIGSMVLDPRIVHTALLNLMTNAIDACLFDAEGHKRWQVTLRTALEAQGGLRLEVSDTGMGMSDEVLQKLFASFFSTKGHRGTGLGLLVTRKLVEAHGGTIAVVSALGQGTTFTIRLPQGPRPEPQAPGRGEAAETAPAEGPSGAEPADRAATPFT
jgi:PAS domain S-box-containing protein